MGYGSGTMRIQSQSLEEGEFRPRIHSITDDGCRLRAFVVIDDTSLGPAAGGIRTRAYADEGDALEEARALARSMTYKCALAGLRAGGGKGVVMVTPDVDRQRAFERLGAFVESLDGEFLTAGDLGTTSGDLEAMARGTRHVYTDEVGLSTAVGQGCVRAMEACIDVLEGVDPGRSGDVHGAGPIADQAPASRGDTKSMLAGLRVAVQGCGSVGFAVSRAARDAGAEVVVADIDATAAECTAETLGVEVVPADRILCADVDIVAPCAVGGVLTEEVAAGLSARVVCGAANNILAEPEIEDRLMERGILYVPGPLSSAGAVIEGVGKVVMGLDDCSELIDRVRDSTRRILYEARARRSRAGEVARELALERILNARQR